MTVKAEACPQECVTTTDVEREMGTGNIKKLYLKYSLAALVGMGIQMLSVIADGIFVGNGVGPDGLAAISIVVPFWTLFVAISSLIGIGATSISAINLGKGDFEEARKYFSTGFWYSILLTTLLAILVIVNVDSIVRFLGAQGAVIEMAKDYVIPYMIGFPFSVTGIYLFYYVRVDEKPILGTIALAVPTVIAIVSEWYFIFVMGLGMVGSALSWVLCVGLAFLLIFYFVFAKTIFRIKLREIVLDFSRVIAISKVGFASFIIQVAATVLTIVVNNLLGIYGTNEGLDIAAYGLINAYTLYILMTLVTGFTIGMQPLASYNYGAGLYARVRQLIIDAHKYAFVAILGILILLFVFSKPIFSFFTAGFVPLVDLTSSNMRVFLLLFPLGCMSVLTSGYFQAIEQNGKAILNGITRIFLFAVPLVYIMAKMWGLPGIWAAQPVADVLAFALAAFFIVRELKRLKEMPAE